MSFLKNYACYYCGGGRQKCLAGDHNECTGGKFNCSPQQAYVGNFKLNNLECNGIDFCECYESDSKEECSLKKFLSIIGDKSNNSFFPAIFDYNGAFLTWFGDDIEETILMSDVGNSSPVITCKTVICCDCFKQQNDFDLLPTVITDYKVTYCTSESESDDLNVIVSDNEETLEAKMKDDRDKISEFIDKKLLELENRELEFLKTSKKMFSAMRQLENEFMEQLDGYLDDVMKLKSMMLACKEML